MCNANTLLTVIPLSCCWFWEGYSPGFDCSCGFCRSWYCRAPDAGWGFPLAYHDSCIREKFSPHARRSSFVGCQDWVEGKKQTKTKEQQFSIRVHTWNRKRIIACELPRFESSRNLHTQRHSHVYGKRWENTWKTVIVLTITFCVYTKYWFDFRGCSLCIWWSEFRVKFE